MTRHKRAREQGDVWKAPRRSSTEAYEESVAAPPPQTEPPRTEVQELKARQAALPGSAVFHS